MRRQKNGPSEGSPPLRLTPDGVLGVRADAPSLLGDSHHLVSLRPVLFVSLRQAGAYSLSLHVLTVQSRSYFPRPSNSPKVRQHSVGSNISNPAAWYEFTLSSAASSTIAYAIYLA